MKHENISALLIESSPLYAARIKELLSRTEHVKFSVHAAGSVPAGLKHLSRKKADVILLDLALPGFSGTEALMACIEEADNTPIVVLTDKMSEKTGMEALKKGAQDYLVKNRLPSALLVRSLRYAIERRRLIAEVERHRAVENRTRAMDGFDRLATSNPTPVTASAFGLASVKENQPSIYKELVREYCDILDMALEQRAYKVEYDISGKLRSMSERLGFLRAGPKDVLGMHREALYEKFKSSNQLKAGIYVEEAQMIVLELMGFMIMYYQNNSYSIQTKGTVE